MPTSMELFEKMAWENGRGEFRYWDVDVEERWKEVAPPKPPMPAIQGMRVHGIWASSNYIRCAGDTFDILAEHGKDYLVGKTWTMAQFVAKHTLKLLPWQREAYSWAVANPCYKLDVRNGGRHWHVYVWGDSVNFSLPFHDAGGEYDWISRDGVTMLQINAD